MFKLTPLNYSKTKLITKQVALFSKDKLPPPPAFKCKVAIVTGGAEGIGLQIVKTLLKNGARAVVIADSNEKKGLVEMAALNVKFGADKALFQKVDVGKRDQLQGVFDCTKKRFNKIDLVVNNAGLWCDIHWEKTMCTNMFSHIVSTQLAIHHMGKHNCMMGGAVVNIMSVFGLGLEPFYFPITFGSNAFGIGFTRAMGNEWYFKKSGVRVMGLLPGLTETKMAQVRRLMDVRGYQDVGDLRPEIVKMTMDPVQPVENVSKCLMTMLKIGKSGDIFVSEECECYKIIPTSLKEYELITCGKYIAPPTIGVCPEPPKPKPKPEPPKEKPCEPEPKPKPCPEPPKPNPCDVPKAKAPPKPKPKPKSKDPCDAPESKGPPKPEPPKPKSSDPPGSKGPSKPPSEPPKPKDCEDPESKNPPKK
ncbi:unnamed protein product [Brassicogethes aeneus]|uniref:Uncharacterized protein n=1 Tax=Brassicogethes aeneus TaxID=1431903 RepID=A0A9P0B4M9_BRAAE|nr:unnamed protein product [Brassicogethes aeneus]